MCYPEFVDVVTCFDIENIGNWSCRAYSLKGKRIGEEEFDFRVYDLYWTFSHFDLG